MRLFGDRPYSLVSTTEIAREAGLARGLLNHYFGTKRDLYVAVVRRLVRLPDFDGDRPTATRPLTRRRVERSVDWFLDAVAPHGKKGFATTPRRRGRRRRSRGRAHGLPCPCRPPRGVLTALGVDTAQH